MVQGLASLYCLIKHHFWNVVDEWNMSAAAIFTLSVSASNTQEDGTSPGETCSALQQSTPLLNLKYVTRFISTCADLRHRHFAVWIFLIFSGRASEISVEKSLPLVFRGFCDAEGAANNRTPQRSDNHKHIKSIFKDSHHQ